MPTEGPAKENKNTRPLSTFTATFGSYVLSSSSRDALLSGSTAGKIPVPQNEKNVLK